MPTNTTTNKYYPDLNIIIDQQMDQIITNPQNRQHIKKYEQHSYNQNINHKTILINKTILIYIISHIKKDWQKITPTEFKNIIQNINQNQHTPNNHKTTIIQILTEFQKFINNTNNQNSHQN